MGEKFVGLYAMGSVMRTGIDTAGLFELVAQIARGRLVHRLGAIRCRREAVNGDVAVRTVGGAETAANAPILDDDLERVAPAN
jgi:hypothetical protein